MTSSKTKIKTHIWHNLSIAKIAEILDSNFEHGLSLKEVRKRRKFIKFNK